MNNSGFNLEIRKNENVQISFLVGGILAVSSFIPLLQIFILQLNGVIFYLIAEVFGTYNTLLTIFFDLAASTLILWLFYKSKTSFKALIYAGLFAVFFVPAYVLIVKDLGSQNLYFLPMLLSGLVTGLLLFITAVMKRDSK